MPAYRQTICSYWDRLKRALSINSPSAGAIHLNSYSQNMETMNGPQHDSLYFYHTLLIWPDGNTMTVIFFLLLFYH